MSDVNVVILSGRVTREPNLRTTPSGVSVCDIGIASNRFKADKSQLTTFARITLWNKQAEWAGTALSVGDEILVNGQLVDDNFVKDGQKTAGRLKIDNARVKLIRKKATQENPEESNTDEPIEVPEV